MSGEREVIGSVTNLYVNLVEDARTWSENDLYVKVGLFESAEFIVWNKVI